MIAKLPENSKSLQILVRGLNIEEMPVSPIVTIKDPISDKPGEGLNS